MWQVSTFSVNGGDCMHVRRDRTAIRDSKNPTTEMMIAPQAWRSFIRHITK